MKNNNYKKGLVFVIVFLFILINILPIINGKIYFSTNTNIIYVDDDAPDGGSGATWSDQVRASHPESRTKEQSRRSCLQRSPAALELA